MDNKVTNYLSWQSTEERRAAKLPKIQELHKEILFSKWETQLIKVERTTSRARAIMNNVIELVNDNLYGTNLISDCSPGNLPKAKVLKNQWRQYLDTKEEHLNKVQSLNWDAYWSFLVKPHSQQMTIKFLVDVVDRMMPKLSDATYIGQLHSRMIHPPEIQSMLSICWLRIQEKK